MSSTQTASPQTEAPLTLVVKRTFSAPRDRVYLAWTDVSELIRWFAPSDDFTTEASLDLRVGGAYRIELHNTKDKHTSIVVGTYREIDPPEKLSFTWQWDKPGARETLVTVDFISAGNSTEVILTHQLLTDETDRDNHAKGWTGCFGMLSRYISNAASA